MRQPTDEEIVLIGNFWDDKEQGDYDFADNFRIATVGNTEEEQAYEEAQADGCCGFFDTVFTLPDGTQFKWGFNYGH